MTMEKSLLGKEFNPETLALGYGYDPKMSEGSVKPPIFLTSTFQFESAEEGKSFFEVAYGLREQRPDEPMGLIYSRLNNPNLQIFEERIAAWDKSEKGAVFASGMAAITTSILALVRPGEVIITTTPVYGGTHYLFHNILPEFGIQVFEVFGGDNASEEIRAAAKEIGPEKVRMLYMETPANPTNIMTDISSISEFGKEISANRERPTITVVDNTFLGPVYQRPSLFGVDLTIYSATKFIGGHSDLIAGVVTGPEGLMKEISVYRAITGTMATPFTGWLLLRSLETLSIRMRRQAKTATKLSKILRDHPKVQSVFYPGLLEPGSKQHEIYKAQCTGPGSLIAFEVKGGEKEAFAVLNQFKVFRLAVSLGGTESLVEHPMTMTHSDIPREELEKIGVGEGLIRVSVGIEHDSDLVRDLKHALEVL